MKKCKYQGRCYSYYDFWNYKYGDKAFICDFDNVRHYNANKCYRRCKNHKPTLFWKIFKKWL